MGLEDVSGRISSYLKILSANSGLDEPGVARVLEDSVAAILGGQ